MSFQVIGLPVSRGVAIGRAVLVASSRVDVAHYFIEESRVEAEIARLRLARDAVATELSLLKRDLPPEAPGELVRAGRLRLVDLRRPPGDRGGGARARARRSDGDRGRRSDRH